MRWMRDTETGRDRWVEGYVEKWTYSQDWHLLKGTLEGKKKKKK